MYNYYTLGLPVSPCVPKTSPKMASATRRVRVLLVCLKVNTETRSDNAPTHATLKVVHYNPPKKV